ncbi:hypothetical protein SLS60_009620 [Paraconiothyrium brasiliense]|uniref:Uncharacterized protein n=1 Tax=Paraconiothyrium brasiliense TaxID=300254 RepID=A0ABR3QUT7_9PLEO
MVDMPEDSVGEAFVDSLNMVPVFPEAVPEDSVTPDMALVEAEFVDRDEVTPDEDMLDDPVERATVLPDVVPEILVIESDEAEPMDKGKSGGRVGDVAIAPVGIEAGVCGPVGCNEPTEDVPDFEALPERVPDVDTPPDATPDSGIKEAFPEPVVHR